MRKQVQQKKKTYFIIKVVFPAEKMQLNSHLCIRQHHSSKYLKITNIHLDGNTHTWYHLKLVKKEVSKEKNELVFSDATDF